MKKNWIKLAISITLTTVFVILARVALKEGVNFKSILFIFLAVIFSFPFIIQIVFTPIKEIISGSLGINRNKDGNSDFAKSIFLDNFIDFIKNKKPNITCSIIWKELIAWFFDFQIPTTYTLTNDFFVDPKKEQLLKILSEKYWNPNKDQIIAIKDNIEHGLAALENQKYDDEEEFFKAVEKIIGNELTILLKDKEFFKEARKPYDHKSVFELLSHLENNNTLKIKDVTAICKLIIKAGGICELMIFHKNIPSNDNLRATNIHSGVSSFLVEEFLSQKSFSIHIYLFVLPFAFINDTKLFNRISKSLSNSKPIIVSKEIKIDTINTMFKNLPESMVNSFGNHSFEKSLGYQFLSKLDPSKY